MRQLRRRRVFYIPGFDPIHPRRYRELYRREAAAQAALSGFDLTLSPANGRRFGWTVAARIEGGEVHAEFEVLVWSDIVRDQMRGGVVATYGQLVRTAWTYIASGALGRLMRLRKGPVIAALYPVVMLLVQLAVAFGLGALAGGFAARAAAWAGGAGALAFWPVLALVAAGMLQLFRRHDRRLFAYYLMHDYAFAARWGGANPPALDARLAEFETRIAAALTEDVDEVLVVGHSSGAHLAVSVLSGLIRAGRVPEDGPALGFVSLGQVVPMMSFLPEARRLRADLAYLSTREELAWVDVTAPGDGCAFALCDPVAVSGVAPKDQRWPLVISAAFTQTLSPARWRELCWRFFRLHFQYLCAFDRPGDYDYFRVTAGPLTLAERFAGRAPSRSAIRRALSPHVTVAA
ncbi:putative integral membrane proteinc [Limimaricola hongkongensis DSM 17492]|uniref:Putative integral membrane proteinc n=2 Tax=Limimaricola hongkongensis TaxID=278132 RepID=A0A017HFB7_9RHOB|nr:putative integral membrane proteinc [Limimaricola hongkongensis DSM 17492]